MNNLNNLFSSQTDDIEENIQYYFYSIKIFPFCTLESKKNILWTSNFNFPLKWSYSLQGYVLKKDFADFYKPAKSQMKWSRLNDFLTFLVDICHEICRKEIEEIV